MNYKGKTDPIAEQYILKVFDLDPGDSMIIPLESEVERTSLRNKLYMTLRTMRNVQPLARAVIVTETAEMGKLFLKLLRVEAMPAVATIVKKNGGAMLQFRANQAERFKQIRQMVQDGLSFDNTVEYIGNVSEEEKDYIRIAVEEREEGLEIGGEQEKDDNYGYND